MIRSTVVTMTETDVETARCPECSVPLTMHHDPGCSQPCGRCAAALPPTGKFRVTIRIERPDGQFVTSVTEVPADLMSRPDPDRAQEMVTGKIAAGFAAAYRRAAELVGLDASSSETRCFSAPACGFSLSAAVKRPG